LVGLQDITAHVDFTALAETAHAIGLQVEGYQRQSDFLLAGDILNLSQQNAPDSFQQMQQAAALKRLLLPEQMGELFKVLSLSKNVEMPRSKSADLRYRL
jgi:SAM-dependent MidA family methyltransferase